MEEMYKDLLKAQKEIEGVDKDGKNPFFHSDYTTLNATIFSCKSVLNANNFVVLQPIQSDENGVYVCTTLIHSSGEKIESKMLIREAKSNDPQAQGSAITYARRYSLKSMLCMTDADDDGEKAQQTYRKPSTTSAPQKPGMATEKQRQFVTDLMRDKGVDIAMVQKALGIKEGEKMTFENAQQAITWLKELQH